MRKHRTAGNRTKVRFGRERRYLNTGNGKSRRLIGYRQLANELIEGMEALFNEGKSITGLRRKYPKKSKSEILLDLAKEKICNLETQLDELHGSNTSTTLTDKIV